MGNRVGVLERFTPKLKLLSQVATIRDPFERFMASVNEHGKWSSCNGEVCQDEIEKAKESCDLHTHDAGVVKGRTPG